MKIGEFEIGREEISVGLMILFAMVAMFFLGYKMAYDKAVNYANEQYNEMVMEYQNDQNLRFGELEIKGLGGVEVETKHNRTIA